MNPAVAYVRVSTDRQGRSGLGLEAQREAVARFCATNNGGYEILAEFQEVESGKKDENRPQLQAALAKCRKEHATLIVAKLDRISRDLAFLAALLKEMEQGKFELRCCDLPEANQDTLAIFAWVAQVERRAISRRTKEALQAKIARGEGHELGEQGRINAKRFHAEAYQRALTMKPIFDKLRKEGITRYEDVAAALNQRGILGPAGGRWHITSVGRVMLRIRMQDRVSQRPVQSDAVE